MKKFVTAVLLAVTLVLVLVSCTGKAGPTGPQGQTGTAGPVQPGLYYMRIFQQGGVYSGTYSGQVQASINNSYSFAHYTDANNPIAVGYNDISMTTRAILKFDLSSLPSSKIIVDKAELTINTNGVSNNGGAQNVTVHKVTNTWTVFQAGWGLNTNTTDWNIYGGDFDSHTMTASASYNLPPSSALTIPLDTAVVQGWMMNPLTNYGMFFKCTNESTFNYSEIYSSNAVTPSNRPMLKVWYYTTE
jgi:hypothetical protein